ncbi:hypothetical protein PtA15_4A767 [Puccinia triticina]|uniref:Uncharacterized protein n=1 Tax=Puccinia triticina TaxID=208348 RepID=A0ABY7CGE3_9BASI|nr:uncharacterized protein PtA15_4A767 [Puccinia triticina]WAQ84314.1 hypothetical protein PtA15_4A767 [Puccinia triticina]
MKVRGLPEANHFTSALRCADKNEAVIHHPNVDMIRELKETLDNWRSRMTGCYEDAYNVTLPPENRF